MAVLTARDALREVLRSELRRDDRAVLLGENMHAGGSVNSLVCSGLFDEYGPQRVLETPVSELAIVGGALGLALAGVPVVAEIYSADFLFIAGNELVNDIPKWRFQHGWTAPLPLVLRAPNGRGPGGGGPEHSQCMERHLHGIPGLTVATPGCAADAAGLLRAAIRSQRPVVVLEHRRVYDQVGPVPDDPHFTVPLGKAANLRDGDDVVIIAWGGMRAPAMEAAERLERDGSSAAVVDPRCVAPLDWDILLAAAERTGHAVIAEEGARSGGVGAEIAATLTERLDVVCRVARVAMPDVPHPYDPELEDALIPGGDTIAAAALRLCRGGTKVR